MTFRAAMYKGTHSGLPGVYNRAVRAWERGPYSHGEMVFSDGVSASASFMDGGVRFKQVDYSRPDNWDFIELPAHLETQSRAWFAEHEGESYDLMGNFHLVIGFIPEGRNSKFCSEAMLASVGVEDAWRYDPNAAASLLKFIHKFGTLPYSAGSPTMSTI